RSREQFLCLGWIIGVALLELGVVADKAARLQLRRRLRKFFQQRLRHQLAIERMVDRLADAHVLELRLRTLAIAIAEDKSGPTDRLGTKPHVGRPATPVR